MRTLFFSSRARLVFRPRRDRVLERVEIDVEQVDIGNAVIGHGGAILGIVPAAQQTAMHPRMQRFQTAVHHFREAGVVGHFAYRDARFLDGAEGTAGGQQLHAPVGEGVHLAQRLLERLDVGVKGCDPLGEHAL